MQEKWAFKCWAIVLAIFAVSVIERHHVFTPIVQYCWQVASESRDIRRAHKVGISDTKHWPIFQSDTDIHPKISVTRQWHSTSARHWHSFCKVDIGHSRKVRVDIQHSDPRLWALIGDGDGGSNECPGGIFVWIRTFGPTALGLRVWPENHKSPNF